MRLFTRKDNESKCIVCMERLLRTALSLGTWSVKPQCYQQRTVPRYLFIISLYLPKIHIINTTGIKEEYLFGNVIIRREDQ